MEKGEENFETMVLTNEKHDLINRNWDLDPQILGNSTSEYASCRLKQGYLSASPLKIEEKMFDLQKCF